MQGLKQTFIDNLPDKPHCANGFEYGLRILPKDIALTRRHIQHNKPWTLAWLVLDLDSPLFWQKMDSDLLPVPNMVVFNPENNHCHLYYGLKTPVYNSVAARRHPLRYLASIEHALKLKWGADMLYAGRISKNPLHEHWDTKELRADLWELGELADWLTLPDKLPPRAAQVGVGRNLTLFDWLRYWAYDNVLEFRVSSTFRAWLETVRSTAAEFNTFPEPLPDSEIRALGNSVAKWVWRNYTKRWTDEEFSERQAKRGKLGGLMKGHANKEKRVQALEMRAKGMTQQVIADSLEVNVRTVRRWLKA